MAGLIKKRRHYYAQFYDATRAPERKRVSLQTTSKREANRLIAKLERDHRAGDFDPWTDDPFDYGPNRPQPLPIGEAVEQFMEQKRRTGKKPRTLTTYRQVCEHFAVHVGKRTLTTQITSAAIRAFCSQDGHAVGTRRKRYGQLRIFIRWLQKHQHLDTEPLERVQEPSAADKMPRAVYPEDLEKICEALREDHADAVERGLADPAASVWRIPCWHFALYSGLRASELARLRWRDIDAERGLIIIRKQKNGKQQTVPLVAKARKVLEDVERDDPDDFVFRSPGFDAKERSTECFARNMSRVFTRYRKKAKIDRPITLHGLRHGFCTMLAEAGKSAIVIKEAARHADVSTSMRYVHMANEHLKSELEDVFGDD